MSSRTESPTAEADAHAIAAEEHFLAQVQQNLQRNYLALLFHGLLGQTGFRLFNAPTYLPAYIFLLSGSDLVVGFALAAQHFGAALASLPGGNAITHQIKTIPSLMRNGSLMRFQILGIALAGFFLTDNWALPLSCFLLLLFGFFNGMQAVGMNVVMAKVIPLRARGRLTGFRNLLAGVVSSVVAWLGGSYFIDANAFGNGYATTFLMTFLLTSAGLMGLLWIREPALPFQPPASRLRDRLKTLPDMLRSDKPFTMFVVARGLTALATAATPFFILFAGKRIGLDGATLGILSVAFLLTQTGANLFWGELADRVGNRLVYLLSVGLWAAATLAIFLPVESLLAIALIFGALGAGLGGFGIASINIVMEFGSREDLPMRVGVANMLQSAMLGAGPLLGGVIVHYSTYEALFLGAVLVKLVSLYVILRHVPEPRHRQVPAK